MTAFLVGSTRRLLYARWRARTVHLYLSSFRFGTEAHRLAELSVPSRRAVVITSALDNIPNTASHLARELDDLRALGFDASHLDLRRYFGDPAALASALDGVGLIWVTGGNSFLLRRAFHQSGLDAYLQGRRGDDTLVYGGYSAGVVVVTPTLRGIELADDPAALADGYDPEVIWDGLGLIPYCVAPHYRSEHSESAQIESCVQYFIDHKLLFVALRDGEVIVANA
jgi:dipeptidase E